MKTRILLLILFLASPLAVFAQTAQPTPEDPLTNKRAVQLAEQLRCLVCQNQSLADSHAELAIDLRRQIREQIAQGRSDGQIVDYMVERYGEFVLYRPPVRAATWVLWFGPPLLLVIGMVLLRHYLRTRRKRVDAHTLTDAQRREGATLLGGADAGEPR